MSADTAIRFRDPFASRESNRSHTHPAPGWPFAAHLSRQADNLLVTPAADMDRTSHAARLLDQTQHGHVHSTHHAAYPPHMSSVPDHIRSSGLQAQQHIGKPVSPDFITAPPSSDASRRGSANSIAPSFQIPRTVNDSGGSLSELAAQMTCLFWFESSELLQQIEDSPISLQPAKQLTFDAKPTTGFRKWVTTILSITGVAQNVVLLSLLFIHRLKKLNPTVRGKPGSEYRLLTVALMLGNKFLDDNTYTNKTWAEVSGINVAEVHIMEVEFLSNMKYCLFTSADDWTKWQSLLGKFASFFDRAVRPLPSSAQLLAPASSLHLPMALPSPPVSNQASPPYLQDMLQHPAAYGGASTSGPTPAPSPLAPQQIGAAQAFNDRKRSLDDYSSMEPASKRPANSCMPPLPYAAPPGQQVPRLPLPSLPMLAAHGASAMYPHIAAPSQQLPPLVVPQRAMAMAYPSASSQAAIPQLAALAGPAALSHAASQHGSRQQSPYPPVSAVSSSPPGSAALQSQSQLSPTRLYLQQRASPYRPVHDVSTLACPPSSGALAPRPSVDHMRYQPLAKGGGAAAAQRQAGRLPYIAQNVWLDAGSANGLQAMTPVSMWPSFVQAGMHGQADTQSRAQGQPRPALPPLH